MGMRRPELRYQRVKRLCWVGTYKAAFYWVRPSSSATPAISISWNTDKVLKLPRTPLVWCVHCVGTLTCTLCCWWGISYLSVALHVYLWNSQLKKFNLILFLMSFPFRSRCVYCARHFTVNCWFTFSLLLLEAGFHVFYCCILLFLVQVYFFLAAKCSRLPSFIVVINLSC